MRRSLQTAGGLAFIHHKMTATGTLSVHSLSRSAANRAETLKLED